MLTLVELPNQKDTAELTLSERLLLGRLTVLTNRGTTPISYLPDNAQSELGICRKTYLNAIANLQLLGLVTCELATFTFTLTTGKNFLSTGKIFQSSGKNFLKKDIENQLDKNSVEKFSSNGKNFPDEIENKDVINQQVTTEREKFSTFFKENCAYIYTINNIYINNNNDLLKEKEINKEKEKGIVNEVKPDSISAVSISTPEPEPKKRTRKSPVVYPLSAVECEVYFSNFVEKHQNEFPQLSTLNIPFEAELFYNYWALEREWVDNSHKKVKSIAGRVATWLGNWCAKNKTHITTASVSSVKFAPATNYSHIRFLGGNND